MANTKSKTLLSLFSFLFIILFSVIAFAQNVEVITYGNEVGIQQTPAPEQNTVTINKYDSDAQPSIVSTPTADTIFINKYSSDYLFSIGASQKNPTVCLCSNNYDKIYITNTAPYEATFTIITNLPEYVSVPFSNLKIDAGNIVEIPILISAKCDAKAESLKYNILVSNNFGTQYTIERELIVDRCQSIAATLYSNANKIKPCEQVDYTVELKNVAPFTEQYLVRPKNSQSFDNAQFEVTLNPGQKTYMNFTYSPDCSIYGEKEMSFLIESINNKLTAKLPHTLIIEKAYDFSVTNPENINLCRDKEETIPVTVKNLAGFNNDFTISIVNKQDFVRVSDEILSIESGKEKTFNIIVNPTESTKTDQIIDFEIKTNLGSLAYRGKINLRTHDCYVLSVNIVSDVLPTLCAGTYTYDVLVENKGLFDQTILLTDNSEYSKIVPDSIKLGPNENKIVSLLLSLPDENIKNMQFKVSAYIEGQDKSWEDSIQLNVKNKHDCTMLEFNKQKLYARYGAQNVTLNIENTGTLESEYKLKLENSNWLDLEKTRVTLQPGESSDVIINLYADESVVQKKYDFKIIATADNGESYENLVTLKMTNIPLIQRLYNKATTNACTTTTSILLILLILGIIAISILAWKRVRVPLAFKVIAIGLIVLIIILVLVMRGLPESRYPVIDKAMINNSNLIWYQNVDQKIDLSLYFFDPDNDTLIFSVEDVPKNISVKIEGSDAILTPDKDWSGNARIRFLAQDNYGGETDSQRINLEVVEVPKFSWLNCYYKNCIYVNAILLIILLALILLLRTRREKDKTSRKVHFAGIKKQKGFLYFVDKDGDVARTPMARSNKKNQTFKKEKVGKTAAIKKK